MTIDWLGFVFVAVVTLVAAVFVVGSYAVGVRMLAYSGDTGGSRRGLYRTVSYICFGLCGLAVLFGVYLLLQNHINTLLGIS